MQTIHSLALLADAAAPAGSTTSSKVGAAEIVWRRGSPRRKQKQLRELCELRVR